MATDRSWIRCQRNEITYFEGVRGFIEFVEENGQSATGLYPCPCRKCNNMGLRLLLDEIHTHLINNGMKKTYTVWDLHGEVACPNSQYWYLQDVASTSQAGPSSSNQIALDSDPVTQFVEDAFSFRETADTSVPIHVQQSALASYHCLVEETSTPLYEGSEERSLETILSSLQLKESSDMTDATYNKVARHVKGLLPSPNNYPGSYQDVKKKLKSIGMAYTTIHACQYGCCLFDKEYANFNKCPICDQSRWEEGVLASGKQIPVRTVKYFPLVSRLQRLYSCKRTTKDMRWHGDRVEDSDSLRHPADGEPWKDFDRWYPNFASDKRNVRLVIASDGFSPFSSNAVPYSCWPVIAIPYNLPPWLCMRKEYNMLILLISGRKNPGKTLNIFMRSLIDELKVLWSDGVLTMDRYINQTFMMRAAVMWTISDFPGLGMLGGIQTKGYKACPICLDDIDAFHSRGRMCYQGARRWLPMDHPYRKNKADFNGKEEWKPPPQRKSGAEVYECTRMHDYPSMSTFKNLGSKQDPKARLCWTHVSIFWELPYWKKYKVRHTLDVMHIEKNVCDNVFGTVLGLEGKTKDDYKSRMTLKDMCIKQYLWPKIDPAGKVKLPQADYAVPHKQQKKVFTQLSEVKYPRGYAGSLRNKIRVDDKKFLGLKTHDCHVMMQRLIPVVIRKYVKDYVADALVEFCNFFRVLCVRELKNEEVRQMQKDIVLILCKLEMIFPPAFFTIMVHLCIHLPEQVLLTGPVHYTWMFSTERQLGFYKKDVKNRRYPEGCIAQRNIIHECVTFINRYLHEDTNSAHDVPPMTNQWNISVVSNMVEPKGLVRGASLTHALCEVAHWCVLQNCGEAQYFINGHRDMFVQQNPHWATDDDAIKRAFDSYFPTCLKQLRVTGYNTLSPELFIISNGPRRFNIYSQCEVNGVKYVCQERDRFRRTQNSGITTEDSEGVHYYGVLKAVVEILYNHRMPVVLFMCQWYDHTPGSIKYDRGLTSVDTNTSCYEDNPFILATNATQVFYIDDPLAGNGYKVVNHVIQRGTYTESTLACTNTEDPSYEVQEPYQENVVICIPISEISINLGLIPMVNILVDSDEDSDEDDDYNEENDSDDAEGFNNDLCRESDSDDNDDEYD